MMFLVVKEMPFMILLYTTHSLVHFSTWLLQDLIFYYAVNQASHFLDSPADKHFQMGKRIMRYVKGTITHGLYFSYQTKSTLVGYSDVDWAHCIETRRSTYVYSIFFGGNLVSWSTKNQLPFSRSSCESKYRAMTNNTTDLIQTTNLLHDLNALPSEQPRLQCDNLSATFLS